MYKITVTGISDGVRNMLESHKKYKLLRAYLATSECKRRNKRMLRLFYLPRAGERNPVSMLF